MKRRKFLSMTATLASIFLMSGQTSHAQVSRYPVRPVKLLVPFSPGGAPDVIARIIAQRLSEGLGQNVIVENRPGANGIIATQEVARATPDGHTLLFTTGSHTSNPAVYKKLPYDTVRDFAPITQVAAVSGLMLVVNPQQKINTVSEFLADARAGKINYGSPGTGNSLHLPGELLNAMASTKLTHIPYKGGGPALLAVASGEIQATFLPPGSALPAVKTGKVRPIATTGTARDPLFPDVPTLAEAGIKGFDYPGGWMGVLAPAKTPPEIQQKLATEIRKVLLSGEVNGRLVSEGNRIVGSGPDEFARFIKEDLARFSAIAKVAKIEPVE